VTNPWEKNLQRWVGAGLIDAATAGRVRAYETEHSEALRWPIRVALALGVIMVGAGVLLFVSAHWDELSPSARFSLVLLMVGVFHVAGALTVERFEKLAQALHVLGTITLGAGVYLAGQIFNLAEHWPGGVMLWALGAWLGWLVLRDWAQGIMCAILTPAWLASEWMEAIHGNHLGTSILADGLVLLSFTYFTARTEEKSSLLRMALSMIGGAMLLPCLGFFIFSRDNYYYHSSHDLPTALLIVGCTVAWLAPLALAYMFRERAVWMNLAAALWLVVLGQLKMENKNLVVYLWFAVGSIALIAWGVKEARRERIDLGFVVFAITVLVFYFSNVFDKLGRSASLISLGILFLAGGWALEKTRRRLVAGIKKAEA
jgi:uncharacterized membrane protein